MNHHWLEKQKLRANRARLREVGHQRESPSEYVIRKMEQFNDFTSSPIALDNSTTQGDPSSMNYYSFYNNPLIETAIGDDELS